MTRWLVGATCCLISFASTMPALALDTNDRLVLTLAGGEAVNGWFVRAEDDAIVVATPGLPESTAVPNGLVVSVKRNGEDLPMDVYRAELAAARSAWAAWVADPPPHPHPVLTGSASALFPGAGQAALGQWRDFAGYAITDAVLLGLIAVELRTQQRLGMVVTLGGVDLILRVFSASEAVRTTSRRRRRLRQAGLRV